MIGATRQHGEAALRRAPQLRARGLTHVQFEADAAAAGRVAALRAEGLATIPARHLDRPPPDAAALADHAYRLADLGTGIIKLVYPCSGPGLLRHGLDLLESWLAGRAEGRPALSLTPHGSRQARVAAALAGSRLVYAPLRTTAERMSAAWYRALVSDEGLPPEVLL